MPFGRQNPCCLLAHKLRHAKDEEEIPHVARNDIQVHFMLKGGGALQPAGGPPE